MSTLSVPLSSLPDVSCVEGVTSMREPHAVASTQARRHSGGVGGYLVGDRIPSSILCWRQGTAAARHQRTREVEERRRRKERGKGSSESVYKEAVACMTSPARHRHKRHPLFLLRGSTAAWSISSRLSHAACFSLSFFLSPRPSRHHRHKLPCQT